MIYQGKKKKDKAKAKSKLITSRRTVTEPDRGKGAQVRACSYLSSESSFSFCWETSPPHLLQWGVSWV